MPSTPAPIAGPRRRAPRCSTEPAFASPRPGAGLRESGQPWAGQTPATVVARAVDTDALAALARPLRIASETAPGAAVPPLGQRIAVARDEAFGFCYDALMEDWQATGAAVLPFSPLTDEAPDIRGGRGLPAGRLPRASRGPHRGSACTFSTGCAARPARGAHDFRRMRGLHGAGPGPDRCRRPAPRHGRACCRLRRAFEERRLSLGYRHARLAAAWLRSARRGPAFAATSSIIAA